MTYSVIDLENNFFLIRFRSAGDAVDARTKGPWIIMGHYLTVQPWSPSFDFTKTVLDQVTVWIRLPGLAVHLYNQKSSAKTWSDGGYGDQNRLEHCFFYSRKVCSPCSECLPRQAFSFTV